MFIQNKYLVYYNRIIENRKLNPIEGYTETHHIIPRSMGGNDDKNNLVDLTAREHFICHRLLVKFTEGKHQNKMWLAVWGCIGVKSKHHLFKFSSKVYETVRIEMSKAKKVMHSDPESIYNTDEYRKKISNASKEMWKNADHKIKMKNILRESHSRPEIKEKLINNSKVMWQDENHRNKMKKSMEEAFTRPEVKESISKARKAQWQNEEFKEKMSKIKKEIGAKSEFKEKISIASKAMWQNEEFKTKHKASMNNPETKEIIKNKTKARWEDPIWKANYLKFKKDNIDQFYNSEVKKKIGNASKARWADPAWRAKAIESMRNARKAKLSNQPC